MKLFEGQSASAVWDKSIDFLLDEMNHLKQNSRVGETLEIMKVVFLISNSRDRWVVHRKPMISPAFAIAELFWILDARDEADFINTWNPIMKNYSGDDENYHGAYGKRLFGQIEQAYEALLHNPDSRQVVLQIWDYEKDLPKIAGKPNSADIPCNISSILKVRNNKLEWSQTMRGNDLFRGTPYNFIQFTTLQEIMAGWLNIDVGEYFYFTDSLHVYESDLKKFNKREENLLIPNEDKLLFSKEQFDAFFPECMKILEKVREFGIDQKDLDNLIDSQVIPQEYKNLLALPLAYIALKSKKIELLNEIENLCNNELLLKIWNLWKEETAKKI